MVSPTHSYVWAKPEQWKRWFSLGFDVEICFNNLVEWKGRILMSRSKR